MIRIPRFLHYIVQHRGCDLRPPKLFKAVHDSVLGTAILAAAASAFKYTAQEHHLSRRPSRAAVRSPPGRPVGHAASRNSLAQET